MLKKLLAGLLLSSVISGAGMACPWYCNAPGGGPLYKFDEFGVIRFNGAWPIGHYYNVVPFVSWDMNVNGFAYHCSLFWGQANCQSFMGGPMFQLQNCRL